MSSIPLDYYSLPESADAFPQRNLIFVPRSKFQWIPMLFPLAVCAVSWAEEGAPRLTDLGFLAFTLLATFYLLMEFVRFPRRFGIGGVLLWGGVLIWFCQDYFTHWWQHDFTTSNEVMPAWVIAKAAFLHVLFVMLMSIGLNWNVGRWAEKILLIVPDPEDNRFYLIVLLAMFAFGVSPYFIFNAEPWYMCIFHAMFSGWTEPPRLTATRTGNLNFDWTGYVAQVMQVGQISGILAIVYTILIAKHLFTRVLGFLIWSFYAMVAFETGRRGEVCFTLIPPIALLFIKFQAQAAMMFRRFSFRSYFICGMLIVVMLAVVQFQGSFRATGYDKADLSQLDLTKNQGNTMFSEGLLAYSVVGEEGTGIPYFYADHFTGEGMFVAIPNTVLQFFVGLIPRALWHDKPVDRLWQWYNAAYTGVGNGLEGTTISHGLVGSWYFKYGLAGMIEGAVLVGWLMGVSERALQHSEGRPISILMSLSFATWLFRTYRDFIFIDLYGLLLGAIALTILVILFRPLWAASSQPQAVA